MPDPTLTPIAIRRVEDATGHVIDRNKPQTAAAWSRTQSALTAIAMLRSVIRVGTAKSIAGFPRPAAGKTGTTEDFVDAWFVGMTPTLTTAVWNGFPTIRVPMLQAVQGRARVRRHLPGAALAGVHAARARGHEGARLAGARPRSSGAEIRIDPATGQRAGPNCPRARSVVMAYAKMPTTTSHCTGTVIPTPEVTSDTAHQAQLTLDRAGLLPTIVQAVPPAGEQAGQRVRAGSRSRASRSQLGGARDGVDREAGDVGHGARPDRPQRDVAARSALRVAGFKRARDDGRLRQARRPRLLAVPDTAQARRQGRDHHADRERRNGLT